MTHANTVPLNNDMWKSTQWKFTWEKHFSCRRDASIIRGVVMSLTDGLYGQ